jgi:hypothetical protein
MAESSVVRVSRTDADWLQRRAGALGVSRPQALAQVLAQFMVTPPDKLAPPVRLFLRRRAARVRTRHHRVTMRAHAVDVETLSAVQRAAELSSRGEALALVVACARAAQFVS